MKLKKDFGVALVAALGCVLSALAGDPYDYKALVTRTVKPVATKTLANGHILVDFGKDAVGWLELTGVNASVYDLVMGEMTNAVGSVTNAYDSAQEYHGAAIRCQRLAGEKPVGTFRVPLPVDYLNTHGWDPKAPSIQIPPEIGVITPFRYVEFIKTPSITIDKEMVQKAVNYPIDMSKSAFWCDDEALVKLYDFFKYSMLATSFCGVYVDGDRERTPYEGDAYINQLGQYTIDDDYSLARKSHEWLMEHSTWPTEWKQHSIKMAWADWMWTGDTRSIAKYYDTLKNEKLLAGWKTREDGLLVSSGCKDNVKGVRDRDIIDWPIPERDGCVFTSVNAIVNGFYYRNLLEMADIARALGKDEDAATFTAQAEKVKASYRKVFRDPKDGLYRDSEGVEHKSLHANAAALAFGLVPKDEQNEVAEFLDKKGLACSVYFAQYLLDAFCQAGRGDLAIKWITAKGERSWQNMLDFGSTISMEAWNVGAKPNLDLNHAWGAAPLNIIGRYIIGVTPLKPGFEEVSICPLIGNLKRLDALVPTEKGSVKVIVANGVLTVVTPVPAHVEWAGKTYEVPAGTHAFEGVRYEAAWQGEKTELIPLEVSAVPQNMVWPDYQRPLHQKRPAYATTIDRKDDETVRLTVTFPSEALSEAAEKALRIRPLSHPQETERDGKTLSFEFAEDGQTVIEWPGVAPELHVFVNPPFVYEKKEGDLYFGPGVHEAGLIRPKSGQTVCIDAGAVVKGVLYLDRVENVKIVGRGVLDSSDCVRTVSDGRVMTALYERRMNGDNSTTNATAFWATSSTNVVVEGIMLKDSPFWTVILNDGCKGFTFDNIKIVGQWRYNSDGIDVCASEDVTVKNSFIRSFDDCFIARAATQWDHGQKTENILLDNDILWCDWGRNCKTQNEIIPNVRIKGLTCQNTVMAGLADVPCEIRIYASANGSTTEDVTFENIEIDCVEDAWISQLQKAKDPLEPFKYRPQKRLVPFGLTRFGRKNDKPRALNHCNNIRVKDFAFEGVKPPQLAVELPKESTDLEISGLSFEGLLPEVKIPNRKPSMLSPAVAFMALTGKLTEKDVAKTLDDMKQGGYDQLMFYPRSGLEYDYLGEDYFKLIGAILKEARVRGMKVWLYDEYNWPSGQCKGRIPAENPDWRFSQYDINTNAAGEVTFDIWWANEVSEDSECHDANLLEPAAMKRFIELVHEQYEKRFSEYFGKTIVGMFTDEPGISNQGNQRFDQPGALARIRRWATLEEDYKASYGRDFRADVAEWVKDRTKSEVWARYTTLMAEQYNKSYFKPIRAWCDKMGILMTGHLSSEDNPRAGVRWYGNPLKQMRTFSCPAIDLIWSDIDSKDAEWLTLAFAQSINRSAQHGGAELFACGPCDTPLSRKRAIYWLCALHGIDTYFTSLWHTSASGFNWKSRWAAFATPTQPWYRLGMPLLNETAKEAARWARKPSRHPVGIKFGAPAIGQATIGGGGLPGFFTLARELTTRQVSFDLLDVNDATNDYQVVLAFDGSTLYDVASGRRFDSLSEGAAFAAETTDDGWKVVDEKGALCRKVAFRHYLDDSVVVVSIAGAEQQKGLVLLAGGKRIPFDLAEDGVFTYVPHHRAAPRFPKSKEHPIAGPYQLSYGHPNTHRIWFDTNDTARLVVMVPVSNVIFSACIYGPREGAMTMNGKTMKFKYPATHVAYAYNELYRETAPMNLQPGVYDFTLAGQHDSNLFLPQLFVSGAFGVDLTGSIVDQPKLAKKGPLDRINLADDTGAVTYTVALEVPRNARHLTLDTGDLLTQVTLGGVDLGTKAWGPFIWNVPPKLRGQSALLSITVFPSIRPLFGSETRKDVRLEKALWRPATCNRPVGLLKAAFQP